MPAKKKQKQQTPSDSEEEEVRKNNQDSDDNPDEQIIGHLEEEADEFGGYNDSVFEKQNEVKQSKDKQQIVISLQKRTTRKCLTLIEGLPEDLDFKKILRQFKKAWCCNGTIVEDEDKGTIIQLQGDKKNDIFKFLLYEGMANREEIKFRGV